jgi:plasmid stability protein
MGQVLIPDVPDETIARFKQKAEINGRTLEAELRDLIERNRPLTSDERLHCLGLFARDTIVFSPHYRLTKYVKV